MIDSAAKPDHPLVRVRQRIAALGRQNVRIIAVSKTHGPERITAFLKLGQRDFGESRQNEARDKIPLVLPEPGAPAPIFHHIGPLQSSGARQLPAFFTWVHGAGSVSAIEALAAAAAKRGHSHDLPVDPELWPMRYLVQVRLTADETKRGGMSPAELLNINKLPENDCLRFRGFMTMGPTGADLIETREVFHRLRVLRDEILPGGELSMGMSGDWEIALAEGATMIRLGTILFGNRDSGPWQKNEP